MLGLLLPLPQLKQKFHKSRHLECLCSKHLHGTECSTGVSHYDHHSQVLVFFLKLYGIIYLFIYPHLKTCLLILERGEGTEKEKKTNIDAREKHQLVASCMHPWQGLNLQPRHMSWLGIELATFHFTRRCPSNWATPARAHFPSRGRNGTCPRSQNQWVAQRAFTSKSFRLQTHPLSALLLSSCHEVKFRLVVD